MSESITVRAPAPMGRRVRGLSDDRFQREVQVAPFEVRIETKRRGRFETFAHRLAYRKAIIRCLMSPWLISRPGRSSSKLNSDKGPISGAPAPPASGR
jgi:hypothetical protein